ncbi:MAG: FadR/GntR family transcriptional regulator [Planctomycetaceae bacterium]
MKLKAKAKGFRSTPERVWQDVVQWVEQNPLPPGGQLPSVRDLASRLGVKPTMIRDSLLYAQAHGAVRIVPRAGAFLQTTPSAARALTGNLNEAVAHPIDGADRAGPENLLHLLDARRLIEVELAGRAAQRRRIEDLLPIRNLLASFLQLPADASRPEFVDYDIRFHVAIARLAGNDVLATIHETLMERIRPHLIDVPASVDRARRDAVSSSHMAVYSALAEGNVERARNEMKRHLNIYYDELLGELRRLPGASVGEDVNDAQ